MFGKNNNLFFLGISLVIVLSFFVIGIFAIKKNQNPSVKNQVMVTTKTTTTVAPTPTSAVITRTDSSNSQLDKDLKTLDQQLTVLGSDQAKINDGLNETLPNLTQ